MNKAAVTLALTIFLAVSICISIPIYSIYQAENTKNYDFTQYHKEYGDVTLVNNDYNFSPPVSMYRALRIALESDGWNTASLSNMTVGINLNYGKFGNYTGPIRMSFERIKEVIEKVDNYAPVTVNGTIYRYYWNIAVTHSGEVFQIPPPGYYWVDAATAEIIPHGVP